MRALLVHFYVRTGTRRKTIPVELFMCKGSYETRMRALLVSFVLVVVIVCKTDTSRALICFQSNEHMRALPVHFLRANGHAS